MFIIFDSLEVQFQSNVHFVWNFFHIQFFALSTLKCKWYFFWNNVHCNQYEEKTVRFRNCLLFPLLWSQNWIEIEIVRIGRPTCGNLSISTVITNTWIWKENRITRVIDIFLDFTVLNRPLNFTLLLLNFKATNKFHTPLHIFMIKYEIISRRHVPVVAKGLFYS